MRVWAIAIFLAACGGGGGNATDDGGGRSGSGSGSDPDGGSGSDPGGGPSLAGCPLFPANFIFNTPIDGLPPDPQSDAYLTTIGKTRKLHLDLGTTVDQQSDEFYGIPYNIVHGASATWKQVAYYSADPDVSWDDPEGESDCAQTSAHTVTAPCRAAAPLLPIPDGAIVEGGVSTATDQTPYGDHHILMLDADACRLWETYHSYSGAGGIWNIYGSASWDLRSPDLRPAGWSSADAAGFPILPLLARADEANSGEIKHALRFTIESSKIRDRASWPARHITTNGTDDPAEVPMGQLFRLKSGFQIPTGANAQARAILQAMMTYGIYLADGGSDMYITGAPDASWKDATFSVVQAVTAGDFEAVDITAIIERTGFDSRYGTVPPP